MSQSKSRAQAGFVLVTIPVVIVIIAILIGLLLPAVQKIRTAAGGMESHPHLAFLAEQIRYFNDESERSAKTFILSLPTDATANDSGAVNVNLEPLKFFCDADTRLIGLRNQVNEFLEDRDQPDEDRKLLKETRSAMDEQLPAAQKLGDVLRSQAGLCAPAAP